MIERYSRPQMKKVWSEETKFGTWLKVEIAVCEAWAEVGGIPKESLPAIRKARFDKDRMTQVLKETHHDVTAFLASIAESIGRESRFVHMGLTSSDVMDTSLSLQMRSAVEILEEGVSRFIEVIGQKALEHKDTMMMGRTHGVHAEPITLGLKLALWREEMRRNAARLAEAKRIISVGKISGAVGTYATVPPQVEAIACAKLGLEADPISNQIIQRDRHAQFVTTLAIVAGSLEKFATEIRALQRTEVLEAEEPFSAGQTGSSAMPHKRNPELCERVCGLARLIRGQAITALENMPLWHERDISHSSAERIILPDSCLALDYILDLFTGVMSGLTVYADRMRENIDMTKGLVFSQRVMLALINKGLSRQEAYKIVQRNAMQAWRQRTDFSKLLEADAEVLKHMTIDELHSIFNYSVFVAHVDEVFARVGLIKPVAVPSAKGRKRRSKAA
ncbi:MAG: adenylosuccinate lyase [Dehalococcoidia bacterium]|nr:adenylosuccinate lyase [Dehalococcoidia bacterium]